MSTEALRATRARLRRYWVPPSPRVLEEESEVTSSEAIRKQPYFKPNGKGEPKERRGRLETDLSLAGGGRSGNLQPILWPRSRDYREASHMRRQSPSVMQLPAGRGLWESVWYERSRNSTCVDWWLGVFKRPGRVGWLARVCILGLATPHPPSGEVPALDAQPARSSPAWKKQGIFIERKVASLFLLPKDRAELHPMWDETLGLDQAQINGKHLQQSPVDVVVLDPRSRLHGQLLQQRVDGGWDLCDQHEGNEGSGSHLSGPSLVHNPKVSTLRHPM
ncbi:hypothetical protein EYF80_023289 [Liparis tanakae]|uniref:Uncharacterized protein n=1 Tax=Liparis tanakae TaxID=230148 RepID=A0A4Z2HL16_9TELE|nr:hypothetical protein EYF80_023289 [Liparis tanakae]